MKRWIPTIPPAMIIWMIITAVSAGTGGYYGGAGPAWSWWTGMSALLLLGLVGLFINALVQTRRDHRARRADIALAAAARGTMLVMYDNHPVHPGRWAFPLSELALLGVDSVKWGRIKEVHAYGPGYWPDLGAECGCAKHQ